MNPTKHQASGLATHAKHGADLGRADRVREELKRGPQSIDALERATGINRPHLKAIIATLCNITGGVMALPGKRAGEKVYALWGSREAQAARNEKPEMHGSGVVGVPVRERPWKELHRDLFEHWRLADLTRRQR